MQITLVIVAKRDRHTFEVLLAAGSSSAPSPGSALRDDHRWHIRGTKPLST